MRPNLRVARPPLDLIGVAIQLFKADFKPAALTVLKYGILPALLGGVGMGMLQLQLFSVSADGDFSGFGWSGALGGIVGIVGYFLMGNVVALVTAAWVRRIADDEPVTAEALWDEARPKFGVMFRYWLALLFLGAVVYIVFLLAMALFVGGMAALGMVWLGIVLLLVSMVAFIPAALLFYAFYVTGPQVLVSEEIGATSVVNRLWDLMAGQKGGVMLLMFVFGLLMAVVAIVMAVPQYLVAFLLLSFGMGEDAAGSFERLGAVVSFFSPVIGLIPWMFYHMVGGTLYYSLLEEKEYVGLNREVGQMLEVFPDPDPQPDAFAPQDWRDATRDDAPPPTGVAMPPPLPGAPPAEAPPPTPSSDDDPMARWRGPQSSAPPSDAA